MENVFPSTMIAFKITLTQLSVVILIIAGSSCIACFLKYKWSRSRGEIVNTSRQGSIITFYDDRIELDMVLGLSREINVREDMTRILDVTM